MVCSPRFHPLRKMPKIPISQKDSQDLFAYFGDQIKQRQQSLDIEVDSLDHQVPIPSKAQSPLFAQYMSQRFFRDGGCVHCHDGEVRAKKLFALDENN